MANECLMTGGTLGLLAPARFFQVRVHRTGLALALGGGLLGLGLHVAWGYPIALAMVSVCAAMVAAMNPDVPVAPVSLSGGHQSMLIVGALFVVCSSMRFYAMVHDHQKAEIAERARRDPLTGLLKGCDQPQALSMAQALVSRWAATPFDLHDGQRVRVTASVGVCEHRADQPLLKTLQHADAALYQAKHGGRNRALAHGQGAS